MKRIVGIGVAYLCIIHLSKQICVRKRADDLSKYNAERYNK